MIRRAKIRRLLEGGISLPDIGAGHPKTTLVSLLDWILCFVLRRTRPTEDSVPLRVTIVSLSGLVAC
jgi:hypothetical protein